MFSSHCTSWFKYYRQLDEVDSVGQGQRRTATKLQLEYYFGIFIGQHMIYMSFYIFQSISRADTWSFFCDFSCPHQKKIQADANRTIFKIDAFHISHFEAYVPNFSKHLWNLTIPQKLWVSALFEVGWSRTIAAKIGVILMKINSSFSAPNRYTFWKWVQFYVLRTSRPTHATSPQGLSLLPGVALAPKMLEMLKCCSIVCFLDNDSDHRFLLCVENISDCLSQENHQN